MTGFLGFPMIEVRSVFVLSVAIGSLTLVNQVEQPFARSLVFCETPVNTTAGAPFTGSLHCGDRLNVIGRGAVLSGNGQTLELFCKIITTFVVSFLADSIGRKAAAIYGISCALLSVVLFIIASQVRAVAPLFFVAAQGLQGCNGIDVVSRTIAGDIMLKAEDTVACAKRGQMVSAFVVLMIFFLSMGVLSAEFTDFTSVWVAMLVAMGCTLVAIIAVMPETISDEKKESVKGKSLVTIVTDEAMTYVTLLRENNYVRYTAFELIFGGVSDAVNTIVGPFMMANFGESQFQAAAWLIPTWILGLLFIPIVPALAKRWGSRKVYTRGLMYHLSLTVLFTPVIHQRVLGIPAPIAFMLLLTPFAGAGALVEAFRTRLVGQDNLAKFAVITTVISMAVGSLTSFLYSRLFVAEAATWIQRIAPFIMSLVFRVLSYCVFYFRLRELVLTECDKMTEEEQKEAAATAEKKAD